MTPTLLSPEGYRRARAVRDLTDPAAGPHAMQLLIEEIRRALSRAWDCACIVRRADPVVTVADNYDRLHYPADGAAREARYTRYVTADTLLRTHTTAMIPPLLRELAAAPPSAVLLLCPGIVYRRDAIDRLHSGEPHQMDVWPIAERRSTTDDLHELIAEVVEAALPGFRYRCIPAEHPYTTEGLQVDADVRGEWIEIAECGLALPALLGESGLDPARYSGLAMGLGMDRLLMLRKGIEDIRLLRSPDPRVAAQMLDLEPYRPVSNQPAIRRDLSIAVAADRTAEELGDRVREALGDAVAALEQVEVVAETPYCELPAAARQRIGMLRGQKNVLLRIVIRHLTRTLTDTEANEVRDGVYAAVHEGTAWQWAARAR